MPTVTTNGVKMNYVDTGGSGTPVLLVHGFPLNLGMWRPQIDSLGERWRIIAPDLKGAGESNGPDDPAEYTMDSYADELKGLIDELDIDNVILAGLSMGGYVAFAFLRKYPEAVTALVLADTRAEADPPEGVEKRSKQQDQVRSEGTSGLIEGLTGALLSDYTKDNRPDVVKTVRAVMDNPARSFIGELEAMKARPASTDDLTSISVPTLIVVGEHDAITPPDASRNMHEHIKGSRLTVIPEAGHLSNLENPDAFNGALADFLGEL
jgi:pimeloyl-ACP methyl ester carboxylesterase